MKVQIISVENVAGDTVRVEVESEFGRFPAVWSGAAPDLGATLAVELTLGESFTWGEDIVAVDNRPHALRVEEDGPLVLVATLEQWDEDGFAALRLGSSVVLTEADGTAPPVGTCVQVETWNGVTLSDTGI